MFFDQRARELLRAYLTLRDDRYEPVFMRLDVARERTDPGPTGDGWRLSTQTVWGTVRRWMTAAGVEHASPHDIRHVRACLMLAKGADLSQIQDFLGHASPEVTKRIYAQYSPSALREVARKFNVLPEDAAAVWAG